MSNLELKLIRFRPEHLEAIIALHRSAMEGYDTGIDQQADVADLVAIDEIYLQPGGEFLVGLVGERVVAMAGIKRLSETSGEIKRMRIAKDSQRRGYGTQLLHELERLAAERGVRTLYLQTANTRRPAIAFYTKYGYEQSGQGHYGKIPTIRFRKPLEPTLPS